MKPGKPRDVVYKHVSTHMWKFEHELQNGVCDLIGFSNEVFLRYVHKGNYEKHKTRLYEF